MYDRTCHHIPDSRQLVVPPLWDSNLSDNEVSVNARMFVVRMRGFEAHQFGKLFAPV
jgi:hypothetical protein